MGQGGAGLAGPFLPAAQAPPPGRSQPHEVPKFRVSQRPPSLRIKKIPPPTPARTVG